MFEVTIATLLACTLTIYFLVQVAIVGCSPALLGNTAHVDPFAIVVFDRLRCQGGNARL